MNRLVLATLSFFVSTAVYSAEEHSTPAASGYDVVSYFSGTQPVKGSGMHAVRHDGQDYLFANEENMKAFKSKPEKYAPQFGGYCAYGAALGKKFHADPLVYALVNDKLYLNLNSDIQKKWNDGQAKMIKDADSKWKKISTKAAASL